MGIVLNLKTNKMKKISYLMFLIFGIFSANAQQKHTTPVVNKVIIYGSDECHHCTDTKAFLTQNNISFAFFDIDKNPEALKEMLLKLKNANISTQNLGIPVVDKNGVIFTNTGVFEEFLQKLKN
jgi:glutaredoxin 3